MKLVPIAALLAVACALSIPQKVQGGLQEGVWTGADLKKALSELGYEAKALSEKKWEVTLTKSGFDVPIGAEFSESKSYVWLTAYLGKDPTEAKALGLLKQNSKTQPSHFYVTDKGWLMMGLPVENRGLTNAVLRKNLDKIATDVAESAEYWKP